MNGVSFQLRGSFITRKSSLVYLAVLAGLMGRLISDPANAAEPRFTQPLTEITSPGGAVKVHGGTPTTGYPEVGALLLRKTKGFGSSCSGTMIGCRQFLTAAHCVCPSGKFPSGAETTGRQCEKDPPQKGDFQVFLQHFGLFSVADIRWPTRYEKPKQSSGSTADIAIVTLTTQVNGVRPRLLNDVVAPPESGDENGTIVGFGLTHQDYVKALDMGIKRDGGLTTRRCKAGFPKGEMICWDYKVGVDRVNSCQGDSGGPLFQSLAGRGSRLAGVTSGGLNECDQNDHAFDANVFTNINWLKNAMRDEANNDAACGGGTGLPSGGNEAAATRYSGTTAEFTQAKRSFDYAIAVADTARLRVTVNGVDDPGSDVDLYVIPGKNQSDIQKAFCKQDSAENFGVCELEPKEQQDWTIIARAKKGNGKFQVTATLF